MSRTIFAVLPVSVRSSTTRTPRPEPSPIPFTAGTSPPRVMQTIASNGPAPARRQASARASRWNWSQETGKAFCVGALMIASRSRRRPLGAQPLEEVLDRAHGARDRGGVLAAHDDLVLEAGRREGRVGADRDAVMGLGDGAEAFGIDALGHAGGVDRLDLHPRPDAERRRDRIE